MNNDLISREALKNLLNEYNKHFTTFTDIQTQIILDIIDNAPTVEQKQGEWIEDYNNTYMRCRMKCSVCGMFSGIGGIKSNQRKPCKVNGN